MKYVIAQEVLGRLQKYNTWGERNIFFYKDLTSQVFKGTCSKRNQREIVQPNRIRLKLLFTDHTICNLFQIWPRSPSKIATNCIRGTRIGDIQNIISEVIVSCPYWQLQVKLDVKIPVILSFGTSNVDIAFVLYPLLGLFLTFKPVDSSNGFSIMISWHSNRPGMGCFLHLKNLKLGAVGRLSFRRAQQLQWLREAWLGAALGQTARAKLCNYERCDCKTCCTSLQQQNPVDSR